MLCEVESVDSDANVYSECNIRGGQTWHRLSIHSSATAGKQMLTAQRMQPSSKITDRSLSPCLQDDSDALSRLRLSGDSD